MDGQVKPQFFAELLYLLLAGFWPQGQPGRVAGHHPGDGEDQNGEANERRDGIEQTLYQIIAIPHEKPRSLLRGRLLEIGYW